MQEIQIPGVGSIAIPEYTWNRPATVNFPGGTQRSYTYDALMRLESLTATNPTSTPLLNYQYTYDEVGNILTKNTEHGNYSYGYDAVSRLLSADNPVLDDESYTYDDVGNRLTDSSVSGSWNYNLNNELLGYADVGYTYDDNGNLTEIRIAGSVVWTYTYDAANRLVHVEDGTGSISADYYYDPFGRRLWKDVGGTRTYFFYSDEGLIAEYDTNGTELRSYGYKPDSTWTTDPLWLKEGSSYYWYQNDHLGTPQKLTDSSGVIVWSAQYTAFGEADVQVETVTNNLRFPGQYADAETGLSYNFQRYYDPKIGRYLRTDPIGLRGGFNLYGYVRSNPVNARDVWGLQEDPCSCGPKWEPDRWKSLPAGSGTPEEELWQKILQLTNNCYSCAWNRPYRQVHYGLFPETLLDLQHRDPETYQKRMHQIDTLQLVPHPGYLDSTDANTNSDDFQFAFISCEQIKALAIADGMKEAEGEQKDRCPTGYYRVFFVVRPGIDYHWYREDRNGTWSHKHGNQPPLNTDASGKLIVQPQGANHNYKSMNTGTIDYTQECGYLCVPCQDDPIDPYLKR